MAHSAAREWDRAPRQGPPPRRHAVGQSARDTHESPADRDLTTPRKYRQLDTSAMPRARPQACLASLQRLQEGQIHGVQAPTHEVTPSPPLVGDREDPTEGKDRAERLPRIGTQQRIAVCR